MNAWLERHPQWAVGAAWLALALVVCGLALPRMLDVGLYYDEAFMAQQARGFVEPERAGPHPGSVREIEIAGRPFPVRNAAYLGSLKSQLLIPAFGIFGADTFVLRVATLATGLLALWLTMAWGARVLGARTALVGGLLVATDPAFYYFSQLEWGPFTTNYLCRMTGLALVTWGWTTKRRWPLMAGGLAFGLGVYSRADFAVIILVLAIALFVSNRELTLRALRDHRGTLAAAFAAATLGALPTLVAIPEILQTGVGIAGRGDLAYRSSVLLSVLDGSHFSRLMAVGGRFDEMFATSAPRSLGALALAATALASGVAALRGGLRGQPAFGFVVIAASGIALAMLAVPGAVRAHHVLNVLPFSQLWMAAALVLLASGRLGAPRAAGRPLSIAIVLALVVSNAWVILETRSELERTGGAGRFSKAIFAAARDLDQPDASAVSLDWGFHEPLMFLTDYALAEEPIWTIPHQLRAGRPWVYDGKHSTAYLVHDRVNDLFGIGPELLRTAQRLEPEHATITWYGDRDFAVIRFPTSHQLVYDGTFRVRANSGQVERRRGSGD